MFDAAGSHSASLKLQGGVHSLLTLAETCVKAYDIASSKRLCALSHIGINHDGLNCAEPTSGDDVPRRCTGHGSRHTEHALAIA
jgi:hypothetical protein